MGDVLRGLSPARIFARPTAETAWLGPAQRSALSHLTSNAPCKILRGPPASGRSLLLARLAHELGPQARVIGVSAAALRGGSVLATVLRATGLGHDGLDGDGRGCLLHDFLAERRAAGQRVVIAIDDAERLTAAALPDLERLSALSERSGAGLELALSAAPDDGATPAAAFQKRAGDRAVHALRWLNGEQVEAYIAWRLERFGLGGLFTRTAAHLIARCTQGRFPAIDVLSQMALLLMRSREAARVDVTLVDEATATLARRRQLTTLERMLCPKHEPEPPPRAAALEGEHESVVRPAGPTRPRGRPQLRLVK